MEQPAEWAEVDSLLFQQSLGLASSSVQDMEAWEMIGTDDGWSVQAAPVPVALSSALVSAKDLDLDAATGSAAYSMVCNVATAVSA